MKELGEDEDGGASASASAEPRRLKSVLTRKPSMAAMSLLQDGFALMSESEEESIDVDDDDEDEGVCSLSEFAMVLNAAAWVRATGGRSFR